MTPRAKRNLRLLGVRVLGGRQRLVEIAHERQATTVILAVAGADAEMVRQRFRDRRARRAAISWCCRRWRSCSDATCRSPTSARSISPTSSADTQVQTDLA